MACKITKEYTLKQGKEEYLMLTADFGSLQMRLTTQDTTLNKSTHGECDPGLYEIYSEDSVCPDAHSATGKNTFVASINGQVYDIVLEDGSTVKMYQEMFAKIKRDGKDLTVKVKDLLEGDDFIEPIYNF